MSFRSNEKLKVIQGVEIILFKLGNLKKNEILCIISDQNTIEIGEIFSQVAKEHEIIYEHHKIDSFNVHGEEPPHSVVTGMKKSDLIVGMTWYSMVHTEARKQAAINGARYLSLPYYTKDLLMHESLRVDFQNLGRKAEILAEKFSHSNKVTISTKAGTSIELNISGRTGNFAPGYVTKEILLGSPPDIEANISPVEHNSNGVIVVDGSIPIAEIGLLNNPIKLTIENGYIVSVEGDQNQTLFLNELFDKFGPKSRILAELGVGFNDKSKLCGNMLVDEGSYGTFHFGFGSNHTIGGLNKVNFHLDFVFYADDMMIDGHHLKI